LTDDDNPNGIIELAPRQKYPAAPLELRAPKSTGSYGDTGQWSYFLDLYAIAHEQYRVKRSIDAVSAGTPALIGAMGEPLSGPRFSDIRSTMDRMQSQQQADRLELSLKMKAAGVGDERYEQGVREQWAMTMSGASAFVPTGGVPTFIADAFVLSARAKGVLPAVLPTGTLPAAGNVVTTARWDTGASVAIQASEGAADSSTDAVSSTVSGAVGLVAGHVDLSLQLLQLADPAMADVALAGELGAALAEAIDVQIINGSGANGQTTGLLTLSGTTSITAGTATQVTVLPSILSAMSATSAAVGVRADTVLLHPRREFWLRDSHDATAVFSPALQDVLAARIVPVPAIPATLGAGTNQDAIITLVRDLAVSIFMTPPKLSVQLDVLSGTLQARVQATSYVALLPRQPKAIGKVTGAGLVSPTFS